MPGDSELKPYTLPALVFKPVPNNYIDPNLHFAPPVVSTVKASQAQGLAGIAQALAKLPDLMLANYEKGKQIGVEDTARQAIQDKLDSGDLTGMALNMTPTGVNVSMGSTTDPTLLGYQRDTAKARADLEKYKASVAAAGANRYKSIVDAINNGQSPTVPPLPGYDEPTAGMDGGTLSNLNIPDRYSFDPNTGAFVSTGSTFGGIKDATSPIVTKQPDGTTVSSYADNGLFGHGGSSIWIKDPTAEANGPTPAGWRQATEDEIAELRKNPSDPRFMDSQERYVAFPKAMYDSGAVRPGDPVQMMTVNPDGTQNWATAYARDIGPRGNLPSRRGWDGSPQLLKDLKIGTDDPAYIYFPNTEAAAGLIAGGKSKLPKSSDLSGMPQGQGGAAGEPPLMPNQPAQGVAATNKPAAAKDNYVDPVTGNAYIKQPDGSYMVIDPTGRATKQKGVNAQQVPTKIKEDAVALGVWHDGMTTEQAQNALESIQNAQAVIPPSKLPVAEKMATFIVNHPALKDVPKIMEAHQAIQAGLDNPDAGGFSDMALIEGFQRMVNPGATVRTQTMENMKQAAGWLQQLDPSYQWDKAVQGDKFSPEARARLKTLADKIFADKMSSVQPQLQGLKSLAQTYGIRNPDRFVNNVFTLAPLYGVNPQPGAPGSAPTAPGAAPAATAPNAKAQEAIKWLNGPEAAKPENAEKAAKIRAILKSQGLL
jgi:hypothetical protein